MNFIAKSFRFVYGFILFKIYNRTLDFNGLVKGRRVAIVGAANSAYESELGSYIDKFDLVIRINKAPIVLQSNKWKDYIGTKSDILFHSFFENEQSGGGPLNLKLFDSLGIQYIINPIPTYEGFRVTFNFYKKYLAKRITYALPSKLYKQMAVNLEGFRPTIGFCALTAILAAEFSEVYITGFTFFKTAFAEGYRNDIKEAHQVQKFIKDAGLHNPDLEFRYFLRLLELHKNKKILVDKTLQAILNSHQNN
jgi:hypothetical protein